MHTSQELLHGRGRLKMMGCVPDEAARNTKGLHMCLTTETIELQRLSGGIGAHR